MGRKPTNSSKASRSGRGQRENSRSAPGRSARADTQSARGRPENSRGMFGRSARADAQPPRGRAENSRGGPGRSARADTQSARGRPESSRGATGRSARADAPRPRGRAENSGGGPGRFARADTQSARGRPENSRGGPGRSARADTQSPRGRDADTRAVRPPGVSPRDTGSKKFRASGSLSSRVAEPERLQKALSRAGLASRREVEEWIRAGRITVNGEPAVLGVRVSESDHVRLDGRLIRQRQVSGVARVFLCHRSPGENLQQPVEHDEHSTDEDPDESLEATEEASADASSRGTTTSPATPLIERIPKRAGRRFIPVSPMPRVDGGLELVTSDGDLASRLQRSMRGIVSEFSVRVHGELSPQGIERVLQGTLDNGEKLEIERCDTAGGEGSNRWYSVVARGASGKDVRQLFERQGALVSRVLRTHLGSLALDRHLSRGRFRELSPEELTALLAAVSDVTAARSV
jgi:23S rRNA pseudouridine2605 synthase